MACLHQSIGLLAHHQKAITECHAREMIDSNKGGRAIAESNYMSKFLPVITAFIFRYKWSLT